MLFQTDLKTLRGALKRASRLYSRRGDAIVTLLAHPGTLTICATPSSDLERSEVVGALGLGSGAWHADARALLVALETLGDGSATFTGLDHVDGPAGRSARVTLYPGEGPAFAPRGVEVPEAVGDLAAFAGALSRVSYSMSRDECRVNLYGAEIRQTEEGLRWSATDGHRLAMETVPWALPLGLPERGAFLGRAAVEEIGRTLREGRKAGKVALGVSASGWLVARASAVTIWAKPLSIIPTPYSEVIPTSEEASIELDPAEALGVVKGFASAKVECVVLEVGEGAARIRSEIREGTEPDAQAPISATATKPTAIGVNPRYLVDLLEHGPRLPGGRMALEVSCPLDPIVARGPDAVHGVMPCRLGEGDPAHPKNRK